MQPGPTCGGGGGEGGVVVGAEARVKADVQRDVEVGLRLSAAEHRGSGGREGRGAGERQASQVRVQRRAWGETGHKSRLFRKQAIPKLPRKGRFHNCSAKGPRINHSSELIISP